MPKLLPTLDSRSGDVPSRCRDRSAVLPPVRGQEMRAARRTRRTVGEGVGEGYRRQRERLKGGIDANEFVDGFFSRRIGSWVASSLSYTPRMMSLLPFGCMSEASMILRWALGREESGASTTRFLNGGGDNDAGFMSVRSRDRRLSRRIFVKMGVDTDVQEGV